MERVKTTVERPMLIISVTEADAKVIARYPHGEVVDAAGFLRECSSYWHPEEGKPDETKAVLFWPDANLSAQQRALGLCVALEGVKGKAAAHAREAVLSVLRGFTDEDYPGRLDLAGIPVMREGDDDYGQI